MRGSSWASGRERLEPVPGVGALSDGESARADVAADVAQLALKVDVGLFAGPPRLVECGLDLLHARGQAPGEESLGVDDQAQVHARWGRLACGW